MKVAIYTRVSTNEQEPENQSRQLQEFISAKGYSLTQEYIDRVSGAKGEKSRPEFARMLKDAHQRKFDVLLVWSLDRLTREGSTKTIFYIQQIDSYGVKFISYQEQYLDTTGIFKDAIVAILGAIAQQERVRISERVKAGLERTRSKGTKLGRKAISENLASQIADLKAKGLSNRKIAAELNINKQTVANYI